MTPIGRAAAKRLGVEPGISGKELEFQQNRKFGPGPIKPFIGPPTIRPRFGRSEQNARARTPSQRTIAS